MSWGEIKKAINSDLNEPLNYLAWINDLATFGEDGYVYKSESIINELGAKSKNVLNNTIAFPLLIDMVLQYNSNVGEFFANLLNDTAGIFDGLTTMELIAEDETAITTIINNEIAMTIIINSETAMTAIAESEIAMTAVFGVGTPNYVNREMIWDNEVASNTIMTNSTGRAWLVSNAQLEVTETSSTSFVLKVNKKCFVLAVEKYNYTNGNGVYYRYIQPGNSISVVLATQSTRVENTRVYPLEVKKDDAGINVNNVRVYYVQMQE